jgi:hypothetical protein
LFLIDSLSLSLSINSNQETQLVAHKRKHGEEDGEADQQPLLGTRQAKAGGGGAQATLLRTEDS